MHGEDFVRELYDASYARLVGQLTAFTGSREEAEDVVQEAFARAVNHARTLLAADNPEAWLRTVAVNLARSRWRRVRRLAGLLPDLVADQLPLEDDAARLDLVAALRRLPAAQREAIALHHLAGLPVHEVATTLGVPSGTVKARLARGRAALAARLRIDETTTEAHHA
ncbi:RNA polymerase sigma-70 factor, ECF subfamily [Marmoricola sp. URHA0025 HA25]